MRFRRYILVRVLPALLASAAVIGLTVAEARDDGRYANSPLKPWFESLHSKGGRQCCADADGTGLADIDWDTRNGHYRVRLEGQWVDVPDETVVTSPNRVGRAMVWTYYLNGHPTVRCFMPGTMT